MENQKVITKFYSAFQNKDAETMVKCYHDDIVFSDPAFGILTGNRAKMMWKMLCKSDDLKIDFNVKNESQEEGAASWEAYYTFSQTGRKVHNIIEAKFEIKDGKIIKHTDSFELHRWAKQALGFKGFLIGGTNFFKNKLQEQTNKLLDKYIEKNKK